MHRSYLLTFAVDEKDMWVTYTRWSMRMLSFRFMTYIASKSAEYLLYPCLMAKRVHPGRQVDVIEEDSNVTPVLI